MIRSERLSKEQAKLLARSLALSIEAVDRCREILIGADIDGDDLAEYDAARTALRMTLEDCSLVAPASPTNPNPARPPNPLLDNEGLASREPSPPASGALDGGS